MTKRQDDEERRYVLFGGHDACRFKEGNSCRFEYPEVGIIGIIH